MNISRTLFAFSAVTLVSALVACDTPDPEGRLNEFGELTKDYRGGSSTNNEPNNAVQVDFSGRYFLSIATSVLPSIPLYFDTTVTVDENFVANFSFQPIKTDFEQNTMARADARTPVGDPIVVNGVQLGADGIFDLELTNAEVSGTANPISGGDIVATIQLHGFVTSASTFCGTVDGQVSEPTQIGLAGSTFGAIPIDNDDLTLITPEAKCASGVLPVDDAGMDAGTDADDAGDAGPAAKIRCPAGLEGDYVLTFKADVQSARSQVKMTVAASSDTELCYTGEVSSLTSGDKIGDVEYLREADGLMQILVPNFAIPPGATPLLPDGGNSRLELTASDWTTEGSCGDLFFSIVGLPITSGGGFAAIRQNSALFTIADSMTSAKCSTIEAVTACGLDAYAGTYNFKFITESTAGAGGSPTLIDLELATNPLTCLSGSWISKTNGATLAKVQFAELSGTDQLKLTVRNFMIPVDPTNVIPFLRDGGLADATITSTASVPGTSMCGTMAVSLIEPLAITSAATFGADAAAEPAVACP